MVSGVAGCTGGERKGILYPETQDSTRGSAVICFQASRKFAKRPAGALTLKFSVSSMRSCCVASDGPFGGDPPIADKSESVCVGSKCVDAGVGLSASAHPGLETGSVSGWVGEESFLEVPS